MHLMSPGFRGCAQLIGVGSSIGDDCAGWAIARQVESRSIDRLRVDIATSPIRVLDLIVPTDVLIICDAWLAGVSEIGTLRKWDWPDIDFESVAFSNSHDFSLAAALRLGQQLDLLPPRVTIWGIGIVAPRSADRNQSNRPAMVGPGAVACIVDNQGNRSRIPDWQPSQTIAVQINAMVDRIVMDLGHA
jgi:hydrogenase maturation protease